MFELKDVEFVQESTDPFSLSFLPSEKNANLNGTLHGGIMYLLADETSARFMKFNGREGTAAAGSIHYYRPAKLNEKIYSFITDRKTGKKLGVHHVELKNEEGKLLADVYFTTAYLDY